MIRREELDYIRTMVGSAKECAISTIDNPARNQTPQAIQHLSEAVFALMNIVERMNKEIQND